MANPKDIPPPIDIEEIQKLLRNGECKIVFADASLVNHYGDQVRRILVAIGNYMDEDGDGEEWADSCMVSDMSSVGDFCLSTVEVLGVGRELGLPISDTEPICAIAARMAGAN